MPHHFEMPLVYIYRTSRTNNSALAASAATALLPNGPHRVVRATAHLPGLAARDLHLCFVQLVAGRQRLHTDDPRDLRHVKKASQKAAACRHITLGILCLPPYVADKQGG